MTKWEELTLDKVVRMAKNSPFYKELYKPRGNGQYKVVDINPTEVNKHLSTNKD